MIGFSFRNWGRSDQRKTSIALYNSSLEFRSTVNGILRHFSERTGLGQLHQWLTPSIIDDISAKDE